MTTPHGREQFFFEEAAQFHFQGVRVGRHTEMQIEKTMVD